MDVASVRLVFAVVTAVLVLLFYFASYRPTRAPFAGWWTLSLVLAMFATVAFLGDGTANQRVLNPFGNGAGIAGVEAAWCAARSLRGRTPWWPWLVPCPVVAVAADAMGDPAHDPWSGGLVYLVLMGAVLSATAAELILSRQKYEGSERTFSTLTAFLAASSAGLALFYLCRAFAFAFSGPSSTAFVDWFGSGPTTNVLTVQLVTLAFSMSTLSTLQRLDDLHRRAVYDGLTGLMRAQEFRREAIAALPGMTGSGEVALLAMADLDHFKLINDQYGHAVGDRVLRTFGEVVGSVLGPAARTGRVGGEEFALLFTAADTDAGERRVQHLLANFQDAVNLNHGFRPTVSVGLVSAAPESNLDDLLQNADAALYTAKAGGRAQIVRA